MGWRCKGVKRTIAVYMFPCWTRNVSAITAGASVCSNKARIVSNASPAQSSALTLSYGKTESKRMVSDSPRQVYRLRVLQAQFLRTSHHEVHDLLKDLLHLC